MAKEKEKRIKPDKPEKPKKRRSVSEFFSTLNTNKADHLPGQSGEVVTNPKSKWVKWILSGTVLTLTGVGVIVPWALASCTITPKPPIDNDEVMYTIKIGDVEHKITYKEFEERSNNYVSRDNQKIIDLTNSFNAAVIKKLYDEENQAYAKFKAIIEQKNRDLGISENIEPTTYGNDVSKTSAKVAEEQNNNLQDAKKRIQGTGDKDWIDKWTTELRTNPIYGFQDFNDSDTNNLAKIEARAVEFMTTSTLKKAALARFDAAQIVTDKWTTKDLEWQPSREIKYQDPLSNSEKTITKDEAKNFLVGQNGFLQENVNVAKDPKPTVQNLAKLAVFQTSSYIPQFRKPNTLLKEVLPDFFNSAVISSIDLAIKPGEKNFTAFTFDKSVLTNLFKITTNPKNSLVPANKFAAILQLSQFKGAMLPETTSGQPSLEQQRAFDEQLITNLSGETDTEKPPAEDGTPQAGPGAQLGSSKFKIFNEHLATADNDTQRWTNIVALGSDTNSFHSSTTTRQQAPQPDLLFTPKKVNPINIFLDLLVSINGVNSKIDFDNTGAQKGQYTYLKNYWTAISGNAGATQGINNLVTLIKTNFKTAPNSTTPFQQGDQQDTILGQNRGLTGVNDVITTDYNNVLQTTVDALTDADLAWLGKLFAIVFMDNTAKVNNVPGIGLIEDTTSGNPGSSPTFKDNYPQTAGFWSTYQLSEQTFLQVNNDGMKIFTKEIITNTNQQADKIDKMVVDDLVRTLNPQTASALLYEITNVYTKINTDEIINVSLINDDNQAGKKENAALFKFKLVKELFPDKKIGDFDADANFMSQLTEAERKQVNESFEFFDTYLNITVNSYFAKEENKALDKITDLLNTNIQLSKYYEFTTIESTDKQTVLYWQNPNNIYQHTTTQAGVAPDEKYMGIDKIETEFINRYLSMMRIYKKTTN